MKRNYQKELEETLQKLQAEGKRPILVLHCCCAPCSTYVLKYLVQYFIIKILFYNPNISPKERICHETVDEKKPWKGAGMVFFFGGEYHNASGTCLPSNAHDHQIQLL